MGQEVYREMRSVRVRRIARKIAEALRVTLSPQEEKAIAAKPTGLQATISSSSRSYMRRRTHRTWVRAQMDRHASGSTVIRLAYADRVRLRCTIWTTTARPSGREGDRSSRTARSLGGHMPEVQLAQACLRIEDAT